MKKILLLIIAASLLVIGTASAYGLYINCSDKLQAGQTLRVSVDSDFPAGTSFDLVFYETRFTATEIDRQMVTVQQDQKTQYKIFDTKGLRGGDYKVEIQFHGADSPRLRSDSVTVKIVKLIDRSGEITISSPLSQDINAALRIEGSLNKAGSNGVQIEVRGPGGPVFGPQWIETRKDIKSGDGEFTKMIPVVGTGDYDVHFSDAAGYIGTKTFRVTSSSPTTAVTPVRTTPVPTTAARPATTTAATPVPTPTQSPFPQVLTILSLGSAAACAVLISRNRRK